jgi:hypothetical protein
MRKFVACTVLVAMVTLLGGAEPPSRSNDWRKVLSDRIAAYGHRNWIVIADAAYPVQARPGIDTVITNADQLEAVKIVLEELAKAKHVRPLVYIDAELAFVNDKDAPGIRKYRDDLRKTLGDLRAQPVPHERIIDKLDRTAEKFSVLVLKSTLMLPYTSVFIELDCGYWSPEAEERLREAIRRGSGDDREP